MTAVPVGRALSTCAVCFVMRKKKTIVRDATQCRVLGDLAQLAPGENQIEILIQAQCPWASYELRGTLPAGVFAQIPSMLSSYNARANCVIPGPLTASGWLTRKMLALSL
jgi:hypothetical protein